MRNPVDRSAKNILFPNNAIAEFVSREWRSMHLPGQSFLIAGSYQVKNEAPGRQTTVRQVRADRGRKGKGPAGLPLYFAGIISTALHYRWFLLTKALQLDQMVEPLYTGNSRIRSRILCQ